MSEKTRRQSKTKNKPQVTGSQRIRRAMALRLGAPDMDSRSLMLELESHVSHSFTAIPKSYIG